MSDDYHDQIMAEMKEDYRTSYLNQIFTHIDDPDYTGVPILLDGVDVIYPAGADKVSIIKALKGAIKYFEKLLYE